MKKSEQIRALQAECDRLAAERDAYRKALTLAHAQLRDLRVTFARRDQTLGDRVRSEFHELTGRILQAVGL